MQLFPIIFKAGIQGHWLCNLINRHREFQLTFDYKIKPFENVNRLNRDIVDDYKALSPKWLTRPDYSEFKGPKTKNEFIYKYKLHTHSKIAFCPHPNSPTDYKKKEQIEHLCNFCDEPMKWIVCNAKSNTKALNLLIENLSRANIIKNYQIQAHHTDNLCLLLASMDVPYIDLDISKLIFDDYKEYVKLCDFIDVMPHPFWKKWVKENFNLIWKPLIK